MKKIILIIILISSILVPALYAQEQYASNPQGWWDDLWIDSQASFDLFAKSTLIRGNISVGGGFSGGVETPQFRFDLYVLGDYFLEPLGGKGGAAKLEIAPEVGISLGWKFLKFWAFNTYLSCDLGYFAQLAMTDYGGSSFILGANGLMVRPKLMTELKIAKYYGITIGVYYQFPLFPGYKDYNGFGILLSIL